MDPWQQLYADIRAEDEALQRDARLRSEEAFAQLTERVMGDVAAQARARAEELHARTGRTVTVEFPSQRPVDLLEDGGAHISFLSLRTDGASLHVYSHRQPGRPPSIHFLPGVKDEAAGGRRVSSEPTCVATLIDDERYEMRALGGPSAAPTLSVDELVLRAFQRLLGVGPRYNPRP